MLSERNRGTLAEIERDLCVRPWLGPLVRRPRRTGPPAVRARLAHHGPAVRQYLIALLGPLLMVIVSALAVTPVLVLYGVSSP